MTTKKVILITGAAKRIGAALAMHFHQKGNNILLHYRDSKDEAEQLAKQLNTMRSDSVYLLKADFNQVTDYHEMIAEGYGVWGRLDGLINNASSFYPTKIGEIIEEQWHDLFASNAKAPLFLSQAASPFLKMTEGCIVNIIDIHAKKPLKNYLVYSMAKASLLMMTLGLAQEYAPFIRVNGVAPGSILWPEGMNELSASKCEEIIERTPLRRQGTVHDIADAVHYFLEAKFVTGQILAIDGGRSIKYTQN